LARATTERQEFLHDVIAARVCDERFGMSVQK